MYTCNILYYQSARTAIDDEKRRRRKDRKETRAEREREKRIRIGRCCSTSIQCTSERDAIMKICLSVDQRNPFVAHRPAPEPWENGPISTVAITAVRGSDFRSNIIRRILKNWEASAVSCNKRIPTGPKGYGTAQSAECSVEMGTLRWMSGDVEWLEKIELGTNV